MREEVVAHQLVDHFHLFSHHALLVHVHVRLLEDELLLESVHD